MVSGMACISLRGRGTEFPSITYVGHDVHVHIRSIVSYTTVVLPDKSSSGVLVAHALPMAPKL
jgi:hypothetical protein